MYIILEFLKSVHNTNKSIKRRHTHTETITWKIVWVWSNQALDVSTSITLVCHAPTTTTNKNIHTFSRTTSYTHRHKQRDMIHEEQEFFPLFRFVENILPHVSLLRLSLHFRVDLSGRGIGTQGSSKEKNVGLGTVVIKMVCECVG